jgi:hypothetical protein
MGHHRNSILSSAVLLAAGLSSAVLAAIVPQMGLSRTSGVVPLAIFVDATSTGGLDEGDYVNAGFDWNFDRDNADPAGKHTVTRGFVAAHVYENPGTYTIQLTVHDRLGAVATATAQVVVSAFSGATYYVASGGSNSAPGTSMSAPLATPEYAIRQKGGPNVRILLRNGDRFTIAPLTISATGPLIVGAYSDPDHPSTISPMLYCSTDGWGMVGLSEASDCRLMDIHLRSSFTALDDANTSPNQGAGGASPNCSNTLFLRMEVDSVGRFGFGGDGHYTFIVDCSYHDYGTYGCYVDSLDHFAMVGVVSRRLKGGQHFIRFQTNGSKAFFAYNDIDQSDANYDCVTVRGNTSQAYLLQNRFDLNLGMHPQYQGAVEHESYCVADGNVLTNGGIQAAAKHVSIRNNLIHNGGISLASYTDVGMSDDVTILNNTLYGSVNDMASGSATNVVLKNNIFYASHADQWASGLSFGNDLSNYLIDNNIYYAPTKDGFLWFSNGGTDWGRTKGFSGWQASGNDVHGAYADPLFVSVDSSSPDFLKLRAASPARGAGATVPVFDDIAGGARAPGLPTDAGAWLYGSSGIRFSAMVPAAAHERHAPAKARACDLLGRAISPADYRRVFAAAGVVVVPGKVFRESARTPCPSFTK